MGSCDLAMVFFRVETDLRPPLIKKNKSTSNGGNHTAVERALYIMRTGVCSMTSVRMYWGKIVVAGVFGVFGLTADISFDSGPFSVPAALAQVSTDVGGSLSPEDESWYLGDILLQAEAEFQASRVDVKSNFGIGTVVNHGEMPVAYLPDYVDRAGFNFGGTVRLPGASVIPNGRSELKLSYSHAEGSSSSNGSAMVGMDGVTTVGLTFLRHDYMYGTGVSTPYYGDVLEGYTSYDNAWGLAVFRYDQVFTTNPNGSDGVKFRLGGGPLYECFEQDFHARADILRYGQSLVNQTTHASTRDKYYGAQFIAGAYFPLLVAGWQLGLEAFVNPTFRDSSASVRQHTNFGSGVNQRLDMSDDGFDVSWGLRAKLNWDLGANVTANLGYEYSQLAGVSQVHVPGNPTEQPAYIDRERVDRHFVSFGLTVPLYENDPNVALYSDIRLKRDITPLKHLDSGLGLYRYRYVWSDTLYVGVMAQEVAHVMPSAVVKGDDGYLRVNYARLGLRMQTWDDWTAEQQNQ